MDDYLSQLISINLHCPLIAPLLFYAMEQDILPTVM